MWYRNINSLQYLPSGKRFKTKIEDVPGPGKYDPIQNHFAKAIKTSSKPFGSVKNKSK